MSDWQPIETAPKDGSYITAGSFGPSDELKWVKHSRWITAEECASDYGGGPEDYRDGWTDGDDEDEECFPTHWSPLEPPKQESTRSAGSAEQAPASD